MKNISIIAFFVIATLVVASNGYNSTWGYPSPYDALLHREIVIERSKLLRVVTRDVSYPPKGYIGQRTISAIRVLDQYRNGTGGYATLLKGGVGYKNVTLHFKSQRGHGFNFILEIYTR